MVREGTIDKVLFHFSSGLAWAPQDSRQVNCLMIEPTLMHFSSDNICGPTSLLLKVLFFFSSFMMQRDRRYFTVQYFPSKWCKLLKQEKYTPGALRLPPTA